MPSGSRFRVMELFHQRRGNNVSSLSYLDLGLPSLPAMCQPARQCMDPPNVLFILTTLHTTLLSTKKLIL